MLPVKSVNSLYHIHITQTAHIFSNGWHLFGSTPSPVRSNWKKEECNPLENKITFFYFFCRTSSGGNATEHILNTIGLWKFATCRRHMWHCKIWIKPRKQLRHNKAHIKCVHVHAAVPKPSNFLERLYAFIKLHHFVSPRLIRNNKPFGCAL